MKEEQKNGVELIAEERKRQITRKRMKGKISDHSTGSRLSYEIT